MGEILSKTVQNSSEGARIHPEERRNGTYHCETFNNSGKCDLCRHMVERSWVSSVYYNYRKFVIHGRNQYVGSTMSMPSRWANTKLRCNRCDSDSTGLYLYFKEGCPNDDGDEKMNLRISLIDYLITTDDKLKQFGHKKGNCSCSECNKSTSCSKLQLHE